MAQAKSYTVRIARRYVSARSGELVDALSPEGWAELLVRVAALQPAAVADYTDDRGAGVDVTVADSRGPGGAAGIHDLACRFGALVHIL